MMYVRLRTSTNERALAASGLIGIIFWETKQAS